MEKLIPLLNERHNLEWVLGSNVNGDYLFVKGDKENKFYEEQIISKKFGFIKWLVDNDKINWRKCLDLWYEISVIDEEGEDIDVMRTFDSYEQLLMYLAIQDNPIEFLVSILK